MASSLGTLIEWYDFYIFGSLAVVLSTKFFPADNPTAGIFIYPSHFRSWIRSKTFRSFIFRKIRRYYWKKVHFLGYFINHGILYFLNRVYPKL